MDVDCSSKNDGWYSTKKYDSNQSMVSERAKKNLFFIFTTQGLIEKSTLILSLICFFEERRENIPIDTTNFISIIYDNSKQQELMAQRQIGKGIPPFPSLTT